MTSLRFAIIVAMSLESLALVSDQVSRPTEAFSLMIGARDRLNRDCSGSIELQSSGQRSISLLAKHHFKIHRSHRQNVFVSNVGVCCFKAFERPRFRGRGLFFLPGQSQFMRKLGSIEKRRCPSIRKRAV